MKIKEIIQKVDNDVYSDPIPIGALAKNIEMEDGGSLEEKVDDIEENIKNIQNVLTWESF